MKNEIRVHFVDDGGEEIWRVRLDDERYSNLIHFTKKYGFSSLPEQKDSVEKEIARSEPTSNSPEDEEIPSIDEQFSRVGKYNVGFNTIPALVDPEHIRLWYTANFRYLGRYAGQIQQVLKDLGVKPRSKRASQASGVYWSDATDKQLLRAYDQVLHFPAIKKIAVQAAVQFDPSYEVSLE